MVLNDIAQASCGFIKCTAIAHAKIFRHGYLNAGNVVAIPDRFQERICKSEIENIHDRFFAKEVIDAEDRVLWKYGAGGVIQLSRRGEVATERLLNDYARIFREVRRS